MLAVGPIERSNVGLHIADHDDLNVLGMNYLSTLERWGVEGRWLILESWTCRSPGGPTPRKPLSHTLHNIYYHTHRLKRMAGVKSPLTPWER